MKARLEFGDVPRVNLARNIGHRDKTMHHMYRIRLFTAFPNVSLAKRPPMARSWRMMDVSDSGCRTFAAEVSVIEFPG
jgi:hypothetical protein